ncbi:MULTISPECIES: DUF6250 domain-containing protein [unclassified Sphingomonas]|uniref:DUF6250 domain-containing protein n=1 Tax=unclassified Sphingomonas TaxID=196159 RepID=UPI00285587B1|nr:MULTISPECIES: DUF6250 domain-containing protein [unclassified Sphingomonas]MDR6116002.1 hypothetical protein [Sphingomonas sp. SORGH_AS_0789]MDR6150325.1 hypothetical protein [Sphingomonas sp. SORGH_AS_0742]
MRVVLIAAGLVGLALLAKSASAACVRARTPPPSAWRIEAEDPAARVTFLGGDGVEIDTARGLTLWYARRLAMPVRIVFEAKAVAAGGPNDQVSDLNAFWMATDPAVADGSVLAAGRHGRFEDYDALATYYVGIGGNRNTTVRMRRYVGQPGNRPLIGERAPARSRDLLYPNRWTRIVTTVRMRRYVGQPGNRPLIGERAPARSRDLLYPNRWTRIVLTADHEGISVTRDGRLLFAYRDAAPYRQGWFAFRTTQSHWRLRPISITSGRNLE